MRRIALAAALTILMLVPATSATADGCPALDGRAHLDWGRTGSGKAHLIYDGDRIKVDFFISGFEFHEEYYDIFFDFNFPDGVVLEVVEHAGFGNDHHGPLFDFESDVEVIDGGSGDWTWSGRSNGAGGIAVIQQISGNVCLDTG
jgi:hypothetical protein